MKKIFNSELFFRIFPIVVLPVTTTAVSFLIGRANSKMSIVSIVLSLALILAIIMILCVSTHYFIKKITTDIIANSTKSIALETIKLYEEKQEIARTLSEELFSLNDIYEIEKTQMFENRKLLRVDIIANSFDYDVTDDYGMKNNFKNIVIQNTKKGIEYNFYITDNPEATVYISDLNEKCNSSMNCYIIEESHFVMLMKNFDFSIYYFECDDGVIERIGFMPLNNLLHKGGISDLYHIKMPDTQVRSIISILPKCIVREFRT